MPARSTTHPSPYILHWSYGRPLGHYKALNLSQDPGLAKVDQSLRTDSWSLEDAVLRIGELSLQ